MNRHNTRFHRNLAASVAALALFVLSIPATRADTPTFTGSTSQPATNTFAVGDTVTVDFKANGLAADAPAPMVRVSVADVFNTVLWKGEATLQKGPGGDWAGSIAPPGGRMGFYRVYANLYANGQQIPVNAAGSRPAGYLTYCIVPNPATRPDVPESRAFFGMQGGFTKDISTLIPLLGVRWVLGNLNWHWYAPDEAGQFKIPEVQKKGDATDGNPIVPYTPVYQGKPWRVYPLPSLYQNPPKWITSHPWEQRAREWRTYCQQAAHLYMEQYPDMEQRVYQVTWEPNDKQQWDGTPDQLVAWHQIAYEAVHQTDPKAVIIGPTAATIAPYFIKWHSTLITLNIWKYLDGYGVHAYTVNPFASIAQRDVGEDQNKLVTGLRMLRDQLSAAAGRNIPIYSTEAGHVSGADPASELVHARNLVESNVIMYGEGLRLSFAFYLNDYTKPPAGFGLYYNLKMDTMPQNTTAVAPKPAAPAYAAMTYLLEGATSMGEVKFGPGTRAYSFKKGSQKVDVIWTLTDAPVEVPVQGARVYDWMGNPVTSERPGKVTVGPQPVYIVTG
jgi:hypothetical protein